MLGKGDGDRWWEERDSNGKEAGQQRKTEAAKGNRGRNRKQGSNGKQMQIVCASCQPPRPFGGLRPSSSEAWRFRGFEGKKTRQLTNQTNQPNQPTKPTSKQARNEASKQASKQGSKQGSKQASKQARKQGSKEANKERSKEAVITSG